MLLVIVLREIVSRKIVSRERVRARKRTKTNESAEGFVLPKANVRLSLAPESTDHELPIEFGEEWPELRSLFGPEKEPIADRKEVAGIEDVVACSLENIALDGVAPVALRHDIGEFGECGHNIALEIDGRKVLFEAVVVGVVRAFGPRPSVVDACESVFDFVLGSVVREMILAAGHRLAEFAVVGPPEN